MTVVFVFDEFLIFLFIKRQETGKIRPMLFMFSLLVVARIYT